MAYTEESLMECLQEADAGAAAYKGASSPSSGRLATPQVGCHGGDFDAKQIYFSLMRNGPDESAVARSRLYLTRQLQEVASYRTDLPDDVDALQSWSDAGTQKVGAQYRHYLDARKAGGPRQYFTSKAHALYFLKGVAPTKLVDGAWLYGLLNRWREPRFLPLIQTYIEELGEGAPDKNHVVLYKKLLAAHGCQQWTALDDEYFVQGAIQLALAQHAAHFLPEVIGYNLGYEQLPLHLLITAYELNELGIDPYYFTLHVTVDNAATGHATQAIQGVLEALPHISDKNAFYRRVINGYKLNTPGASTNSVIAEFDLDAELLVVLAAKSKVGAQLHSDYCRVGGKLVNEWLSDPAQLPGFLEGMQRNGWIKRHQPPENSRFWKLIEGEQAQMFGVFNAYEKQVIHDWIAGDALAGARSRPLSFRATQRVISSTIPCAADERSGDNSIRSAALGFTELGKASRRNDDFDADLRLLEHKLAGSANEDEAMALVIEQMSPTRHHTGAGLMATRLFTRWLHSA